VGRCAEYRALCGMPQSENSRTRAIPYSCVPDVRALRLLVAEARRMRASVSRLF